MTKMYYRYETIQIPTNLPIRYITWPGQGGCSNRQLSVSATNYSQPPAAGNPGYIGQNDLYTRQPFHPNSGIRRQGRPKFGFTKYSTGTVKRESFLVKVLQSSTPLDVWYQFGYVSDTGSGCTPHETSRSHTGPQMSTWYLNTVEADYASYPVYDRSSFEEGQINPILTELRNEMIAEASTSYDILTDIAELKDIPRSLSQISGDLIKILGLLKGRHSLDVLRNAKSISPSDLLKHPSKLFRMFGDEWMNYRYGIMPLVYSYRDIMKTINRGSAVKTRKTRTITPFNTGEPMPSESSTYRVRDVTGSIVLRGEVFQYFTADEVARLSGIGFNPLVTAWELIPYSFVIDWFVNVGSYIAARTANTWSFTKFACLSRRDKYTKTYAVHLPNRDLVKTVVNKMPTGAWNMTVEPSSVVVPNPAGDYPLSTEDHNTYDRWVIPVTPVAPRFNPSLNWRRLIDGAVMSINQLGRLIKRL